MEEIKKPTKRENPKLYYENNKHRRLPKKCECGRTISYYGTARHYRSPIHKKCMELLYNELKDPSGIIPTGEIHSQTGEGLAIE